MKNIIVFAIILLLFACSNPKISSGEAELDPKSFQIVDEEPKKESISANWMQRYKNVFYLVAIKNGMDPKIVNAILAEYLSQTDMTYIIYDKLDKLDNESSKTDEALFRTPNIPEIINKLSFKYKMQRKAVVQLVMDYLLISGDNCDCSCE